MSKIQENIDRGWADIEGFPGYRITVDGKVFSAMIRGRRSGEVIAQGLIERRIHSGQKGYLHTSLKRLDGKYKTCKIHRIVALHFIEGGGIDLQVNHKDGCKTNNHYTNLEWSNAYQNVMHSVDNGLRKYQKLTPGKALEIKKRIENKENFKSIALLYKVSITTIFDIRAGRSWSHVKHT